MNELLDSPYLKDQIIPYIGNKRRLLPLILKVIEKIGYLDREGSKFLDLFAGSGVVSRLGKLLGFEVYSNDWEYYSFLINSSYLTVNRSDIENMYIKWGGIDGIIMYLNSLEDPKPEDEFIARYYSPRNDSSADYKSERLFYTRYNGLIVDKVRDEIERLYPEEKVISNKKERMEKNLLLSLLIYNAATHTNTSGVFKAYHKGFGGFSKDALGRILKRIQINRPVLIDSKYKNHVFKEDANKLVKEKDFRNIKFDIAYIDPPYNQHQYGSNYHLLNTIVNWDKEYIANQLDGRKPRKKAGIRDDWVKTRSLYCYKDSAAKLFKDLLESLNGRYLLISYNTEGIIPIEQLVSIASEVGRINIIGNEYVKYRGGKQSISRVNNNIEFLLIIDKERKNSNKDIFKVSYEFLKKKLHLQFKKSYSRYRLEKYFNLLENYCILFLSDEKRIRLRTRNFFKLNEDDLIFLFNDMVENKKSYDLLLKLLEALENSQCRSIPEEIEQILGIIKNQENEDESKDFVKDIPKLLKKIAHKKYRDIFYKYIDKVRKIKKFHLSYFNSLEVKIKKIEDLAEKRFNG